MRFATGFPALYPILDASFLLPHHGRRLETLAELVADLASVGVEILQYRNKQGTEAEILTDAETMRGAAGSRLKLILNDFPSLALLADFDGVHVGQHDVTPQEARRIVGSEKIVGVSTHNEAQLQLADRAPVDYVAIGPVFVTSSKQNPDPVVGLAGVRLARSLTNKPVVAIGGITFESAPSVRAAGADSIALISAIFNRDESPAKLAKDFLRIFG